MLHPQCKRCRTARKLVVNPGAGGVISPEIVENAIGLRYNGWAKEKIRWNEVSIVTNAKEKLNVIVNAQLMDEWDWKKNNELGLEPSKITYGSGKKAWWKCGKGHEWIASIKSRTTGNTGCPICDGKIILPGFNDLATWCKKNNKQFLLDEWDYEINNSLTPQTVAPKAGKKVWWKCKKGHSWHASVIKRTDGRGCPICANRLIYAGINDLATWCRENNRIDLLEEWDYEENKSLTPEMISKASGKKVWWQCKNGHSYSTTVAHRVKDKSGCPVCAGNIIENGFNDFATWCKKNKMQDLLEEWDYDSNKGISPQTIAPKTSKKVWWKCDLGHKYIASVAQRTDRRSFCPICAGKKVEKGFNDLTTWCLDNNRQNLLDEWDYEKNGVITPEIVTKAARKRIWWKCRNNHSWSASLTSRTSQDIGCPYCSNKKVLAGFNDFKTWCQDNNRNSLLNEWDNEKNESLTPEMVTRASNKKVWWRCEKGHSWYVQVCNRTTGNTGCPFCSGLGTSFPEQAVAFYLSKSFRIKQRHKIDGFEYDVFLEEYNIGIEYDGIFYHSKERTKRREKQKDSFSQKQGIVLLRIKECKIKVANENNIIFYPVTKSKAVYLDTEFNNVILSLMERLEFITGVKAYSDIDTVRDELLIRERYSTTSKEERLSTIRPDLILEWNEDKNRGLSPDCFTLGSNTKVWWKCNKGHEWEASIHNRALSNTGCPICNGKIILPGFNDLATWCNDHGKKSLLDEWDYKKNENITPQIVAAKTSKKVWWKCEKGHSWQAQICNRTAGNCCPVCMNRIVLAGYNDFASWCGENNRQDLLDEWDNSKNKGFSPSSVGPNTKKKVWWRCKKGHQWQSTVQNRKKGQGCPVCSHHKVQTGFNDLETWCIQNGKQYLIDEWDFGKNGSITPNIIARSSHKKTWWICKMGHSWQAVVNSRTQLGSGCPVCSGRITQEKSIECADSCKPKNNA